MKSIANKTYTITKKIGNGTYGKVYKCVREEDKKEFAFKKYEVDKCDLCLGILREISVLRIFKGNTHYIVNLEDIIISLKEETEVIDDDDERTSRVEIIGVILPLYVCDLRDMIGKLNKEQKNKIATQILVAVSYLHENGIIHRDIKPENILLDSDMNAFLADFSLSKAFLGACSEGTHTGNVVTATYRAPEIIDDIPYTMAVDSWSIGVLFYELFKGAPISTKTDKGTIKYFSQIVFKTNPIGRMIKSLLEINPDNRASPKDVLEGDYFKGNLFGIPRWQPTTEIGLLEDDINEMSDNFNVEKNITRWAAQIYYKKTGCSTQAAVMLACKLYETELINTDDQYEYAEEEIEILGKMKYNLFV